MSAKNKTQGSDCSNPAETKKIIMKKIFLFFFLFLVSEQLYAQKQISAKKRFQLISAAPVVYLWDTIYSKAKPYCIMKELKVNEYHPDFIIQNLLGENCLYIRYDKAMVLGGHYNVRFTKSGKNVTIALKDENDLPDFIVSNDLFIGNEIPESREKNFLDNYCTTISTNQNQNELENTPENIGDTTDSNTLNKSLVTFPIDSSKLTKDGGISVPLIKGKNQIYSFSIMINDCPVDFHLDTGAADVIMPKSMYTKLLASGCIVKGNILEQKLYTTAGGKLVMGQVVTISDIDIEGVKIYNVKAAVLPNGLPLFGLSALSNLAKVQLDFNNSRMIIYK